MEMAIVLLRELHREIELFGTDQRRRHILRYRYRLISIHAAGRAAAAAAAAGLARPVRRSHTVRESVIGRRNWQARPRLRRTAYTLSWGKRDCEAPSCLVELFQMQ